MDGEARIRIEEALSGLELVEATFRRPRFSRHAHPTYAVGAVSWGANRFRYRGAFHVAPAGTLCTVTPDEVHEVEPAGDLGFAYRCLYPEPAMLASAAAALGGRRAAGTLALPPVIEDAEAARLVAALFDAEAAGRPRLAREADLLALLARLVTRHALDPVHPRAAAVPPAAVARARDYLSAHCAENVALAALSDLVGLDPFALLRGFSRAYGLPPHAWLLQERVRRAKRLLADGRTPADVAGAVGFADQSHLTRHFRRILGVTPGRYRRAALSPRR